MLKYAVLAFLGGLIGAFISYKLGYNDGSLSTYLTYAFAASIGGSIGGLIRQNQNKQADKKE